MATLVPPTLPSTATAGERTIAAALARHLPGAVAWYEPRLPRLPGPRGVAVRPDFLVLGRRGLAVLEVKGWRLRDVREAGPNRFQLERGRAGQPEMQAYRYTLILRELLDAAGLDAGPVRYGLVLPYIARAQLAGAAWAGVLDPAHLVLRDDLGAVLGERLRALPPGADTLLAPEVFAAVRTALHRSAAPTGPDSSAQPSLFDEH
jgi:hypothetical protein